MKGQVTSWQRALYASVLTLSAATTAQRVALAESPKLAAESGIESPGASARRPPIGIFGGYSAYKLSNPGLHLGVEHSLLGTARFQSLATASFHLNHQADAHTAYALQLRWGQRYTAPFGLSLESYLGLGLQITHYETTSFEFIDGVAVEREGGETRFGIAPHVVFGPGYDFAPLLDLPILLYVRPGVQLLYPDLNLALQVAGTIEAGARWTFD